MQSKTGLPMVENELERELCDVKLVENSLDRVLREVCSSVAEYSTKSIESPHYLLCTMHCRQAMTFGLTKY